MQWHYNILVFHVIKLAFVVANQACHLHNKLKLQMLKLFAKLTWVCFGTKPKDKPFLLYNPHLTLHPPINLMKIGQPTRLIDLLKKPASRKQLTV